MSLVMNNDAHYLMSHAPVYYLDPDYVEPPIVLTIISIVCYVQIYRISLNIGPGVYFLPASFDPVI